MTKEALGQRIREARVQKAYSQQELAQKADMGKVYLSEIERGIKMPSLYSFIKIIEALDISADSILRDELSSGSPFVYDGLLQKLNGLTPQQRTAAAAILDAYLDHLP